MKPVTYYQSAIGMPFASDGKNIASWLGEVRGRAFYGTKSVRRFERDHFPISRLQVITSGMPEKYKRGLLGALRRARKEGKA